jgi:hypothetical protein
MMGIYIFIFIAAPAVYGSSLFYLRLGRALARQGKACGRWLKRSSLTS